jgi:threonine/homoserine/homoserine lactone efflux protein
MGSVIGDILPVALGVAISPVPVIAVILMLLAPRARSASVGFMVGWVVGVTVVVMVVTLLVQPSGSSDPSDPSTVAGVLLLLLGAAAILLGVLQWLARPKPGEEPWLPAWMAAIDSMTVGRAFGLGILLSAANPKNLTLCLAGGATIGGADLSPTDTVVVLVVFVAIASSSVVAPVLAYLLAHDRMQEPLDNMRRWLTANNATVMSVLLLVIGAAILGKGLDRL